MEAFCIKKQARKNKPTAMRWFSGDVGSGNIHRSTSSTEKSVITDVSNPFNERLVVTC